MDGFSLPKPCFVIGLCHIRPETNLRRDEGRGLKRSQNLNCKQHFYCRPQINRAHAVPPTFASFFCFVLKTVTGNKILNDLCPFCSFKRASRLLSDGPSKKKCERRFAKKAIRQKKTVKPKVERQTGKIDALSFSL